MGFLPSKDYAIQDIGGGGLLMASSGDQLSLWTREFVDHVA